MKWLYELLYRFPFVPQFFQIEVHGIAPPITTGQPPQ
jgi:hypothetical protein